MRIFFVRHGEPDYIHDSLTENGFEQAKSTAERLSREPITKIYSSPLGRAFKTAGFTAAEKGLEVEILECVREIDWGSISGNALKYDGHPWTLSYELLVEHPEYVANYDWDLHTYFKDNICLDHHDRVTKGFDSFLASHGVVRENGLYRMDPDNRETIAVFAHGGSMACVFSHILNLPLPFVLTSMPFGVCSVTEVEILPQNDGTLTMPRIVVFNEMSHLKVINSEALKFGKSL